MSSDRIESVDLRHSLITAASCWLAATFVFLFHCDNPWWGVISAWVISSQDFHQSSLKAMMRVAGTLAGYFVGLICASVTRRRTNLASISPVSNRCDWPFDAVSKQIFLCLDHRIGYHAHPHGSRYY
jgi:Fusaric acid resistance protein-like